jgi:hypothetical protein
MKEPTVSEWRSAVRSEAIRQYPEITKNIGTPRSPNRKIGINQGNAV